jgi:uncharacterized membrane-anchored protein
MPPVTSAITLNVHPSRDELHEELHSRDELHEELHSRPSPLVETPCTISHIAVQIGAEERVAEREYLGELCTRFDTNPPREGASCFYQTFGGFELRWEKHTEFSTYTFIQRVLGDPLRQAGALTRVPGDWLAKMPGKVTTALHLAFSCAEGPIDPAELDLYFEKQPLRGGVVRQVLEVETYRLMALLALPVARKIAPDVRTTERELARITQELTHAEEETDQRALLDELSKLAARVERHRSDTTYRFAATNAYYDLVEERIQELGEDKIPGLQSIRVFIERRLAPGIRTCNAVRDRLEGLSGRISQASELLRARVELSIQGQNRELLTSMNRRSEVQLRLQQAVEGLSVVAMTYYLMGLLGYLYEGLAWTGLALDKKIGFAIAVPVVMLAVWKVIHGVRRRIEQP